MASRQNSQVVFESDRYSVPTEQAKQHLVLKAYPFPIEIPGGTTLLACHEHTYQRKQKATPTDGTTFHLQVTHLGGCGEFYRFKSNA